MTQEEFDVKAEELLRDIPDEFRSILNYMAYERGHAYGYDEVLNILDELVYKFKEPIEQYTQRITTTKAL
jgi:hypothetical protein